MTRRPKGEGRFRHRADGLYETTVMVTDKLGRTRPKSIYGRTEREASQKKQAYLADVARGAPTDPSKQPLGDYLTEWLAGDATRHVSPSVLVTYELMVRRHITPLLGHLPLCAVTPWLVQTMVDELERQGKLAPASVAKARGVLQSALGDAVRRGLINQNPASLARVSHEKRSQIDYWEPDEARQFLAAVKGHPMEAFYTLSLMLGWRISEGLGLPWRNVDLDRGILSITRGLERGSRTTDPVFTDTKNRGSRRTVRLPKAAIAALTGCLVQQQWMERIARGVWHNQEGFVFTTSTGRPLAQSNIRRQFVGLCKAAGVRQIRVHDMRHTAATLMIRSGVNIKVISETLGHSSIRITLDLYGHLLDDQKQQVADAMDQMLGGL